MQKIIAGIDFSIENFKKITKDYVGGNAEIITKNYNSLPEYQRPIYVFIGEDHLESKRKRSYLRRTKSS